MSFSESNRTCRISSDDQSQTFDVLYADVQPSDRPWKRLWVGEPVEFGIDHRGSAANVLQLDQRPALFRFSDKRSLAFGRLQHLSRIAEQNEEWDYRENPTAQLPILRFYIEKTFEQLLAQNKVLFDEDDPKKRSHACFNTGLVNELQEEILGVFDKNPDYDGSPLTAEWRLDGYYTTNDRRLASFSQTEFPLATYFTKVSELYLDPNETRITLLWPHLIRRLERFPEGLQTLDAARGALERAFRDAMRRLARNYKTVVPQFYEGEIQLLLPVALADPRVVDRALVLRRQGKTFEATTVFYLDWAYESARIVAKPDKEWLHPVRVRRKGDQDEGEGQFKERVEDQAVQQSHALDERTEQGEGEAARSFDTNQVKVGSLHLAPVTRIEDFGVFAQIPPGVPLLCHISEYENRRIRDLNDEVKIGQVIYVEVIERMDRGTRKLALSRKAVIKAKTLKAVLEAEGRTDGNGADSG